MLGQSGCFVGIELDDALCRQLRQRLGARACILHRDVLEVDLSGLIGDQGFDKATVVGNLPYSVTGPILRQLLGARSRLVRAVIMVQREVAVRMTAGPGSKDYGVLSLAVQVGSVPERLFDLGPQQFDPPPKVHSSVVRLRFDVPPPVRPSDEGAFFRVVRAAFSQRRKMLRNALQSMPGVDEAVVGAALQEAGIEPTHRAERVSPEGFERLSAAFSRILADARGCSREGGKG